MADFTDEMLDRDWKPNGRRPKSTIARSFSQELMDIFRIENSVADLDNRVDKRRQAVSTQSNELEALEARIREMEDRLRRSQHTPARAPVPQQQHQHQHQRQHPQHPREQHQHAAYSDASLQENVAPPTVTRDHQEKPRARRGTRNAHHTPMSGGMPPTPVASEGEYDIIDRADLVDDKGVGHPRA